MAADIVNLRHARKQKARADKVVQAAENRAKFGRSKADKLHDAAESGRARRQLDQLKHDDESGR